MQSCRKCVSRLFSVRARSSRRHVRTVERATRRETSEKGARVRTLERSRAAGGATRHARGTGSQSLSVEQWTDS